MYNINLTMTVHMAGHPTRRTGTCFAPTAADSMGLRPDRRGAGLCSDVGLRGENENAFKSKREYSKIYQNSNSTAIWEASQGGSGGSFEVCAATCGGKACQRPLGSAFEGALGTGRALRSGAWHEKVRARTANAARERHRRGKRTAKNAPGRTKR